MQEEDVCNHDSHDAFIRRGSKTVEDPGTQKRVVRRSGCLPDVGTEADEGAHERNDASAENVATWDDDKIAISKRQNSGSGL